MDFVEIINNKINLVFVVIIVLLALFDIFKKKDLKSQIVSVGVLGTFVGIFIGLQDFNPENMKESINHILIGLKTAFFTSIVGMLVSILLSVIQKLFNKEIDDENKDEFLLSEIVKELKTLKENSNNNFEKLNQIIEKNSNEKIIDELEKLRLVQIDTKESNEKISKEISELRINSNKENQELINILNVNFNKMNNSLEVAIEKLSKGATEEIIKALKEVIEDFNQELQTQFGENFVKLNEAVINLITWQENYKNYIEKIDNHLNIAVNSIDKSKDLLEIVSSKNEEVINIYNQLENIIKTYDLQVEELNKHLQTYADLSDKSEEIFESLQTNVIRIKENFNDLTQTIKNNNDEQKNHTIVKTDEIKELYSDLTEFVKNKHNEEKNNFIITIQKIENTTKESFNYFMDRMEKTIKELELITNHYKNLGEEIPKALQVSLENLNRGLTSITKQFQKDYDEIINKHKSNMK